MLPYYVPMKRLPIKLLLASLFVVSFSFGQNNEKLAVLSAKIAFENSESTALKENMHTVLDDLAQVLNEDKFMYEIASYSSRAGSAKENQEKTETRAQRIKEELIKRGVQEWRLVPFGYGEAANEHVIIKILPN